MSNKQKWMIARIVISIALLLGFSLVPIEGAARLAAFVVPYAVIGYDVLFKAARNIARGRIFDENFLMTIATIGAFFIGDYTEAAAVMLFYQVGELFQGYAVGRSRKSIASLMDLRPDSARVERGGAQLSVDPEEVGIGETIVVFPGEKIPLDGVVVEGASTLDTSALTGESAPRGVGEGSAVLSGCVNLNGLLRVKVEKEFGESTVSKILELVESAGSKKARAENFITRFARYYTPCVVVGAVLLAVIPPLLFGGLWGDWVKRALIFLVISCPCALVISIPLSFFGGIGGASRCGILVKGGNYLEALSKTGTVVFDKTGTLTEGSFKVRGVYPESGFEGMLEWAALAEQYSNHPIAQSLRQACGVYMDAGRVSNVEEKAGYGVCADVDGRRVAAGNEKLMEKLGVTCQPGESGASVVHVAVDNVYAGRIVIADELKPGASDAVASLKGMGIRVAMLTGDAEEPARAAAKKAGVDEVYAGLLPGDKVKIVEKLLDEKEAGKNLIFVGDGVNDAPVLSRADVGVAMGAMGSDAAIEAADIVLMDDQPAKICTAMRIAKKTVGIARQNTVFALGVKALFLALGAFGAAGMWEAVFADVGVALIAILNASRTLRTSKYKKSEVKARGGGAVSPA